MTAAELLELTTKITAPMARKLAHTLGWPPPKAFHHQRPGRVKWANPYRNYYAGSAEDPDWKAAAALGLAEIRGGPREGYPYTTWTVTELGKRAIRLRLQAARWAAQVTP